MTIEAEDYLPKRVKLISLGDAGAGKSAIIKVKKILVVEKLDSFTTYFSAFNILINKIISHQCLDK